MDSYVARTRPALIRVDLGGPPARSTYRPRIPGTPLLGIIPPSYGPRRAGPPTRASPGRHRRPQVSRARATRHRRYGHRLSRGAPPHGSHLCVEGAVAGLGRDARGPAALRGRGPGHWCAAPSQRGRRRGLRIRGHGLGQVPVSGDGAARGLSPQSHPGRRRRTAVAVGHVRAGADSVARSTARTPPASCTAT